MQWNWMNAAKLLVVFVVNWRTEAVLLAEFWSCNSFEFWLLKDVMFNLTIFIAEAAQFNDEWTRRTNQYASRPGNSIANQRQSTQPRALEYGSHG